MITLTFAQTSVSSARINPKPSSYYLIDRSNVWILATFACLVTVICPTPIEVKLVSGLAGLAMATRSEQLKSQALDNPQRRIFEEVLASKH